MNDFQIVFCTVPDVEHGRKIAFHLVEYHLAACVNIVPEVLSVYRWEEQTRQDNEVLLKIKTTTANHGALLEAITALHPYELPEIVAVPLSAGHPGYLDWLKNSCKEEQ